MKKRGYLILLPIAALLAGSLVGALTVYGEHHEGASGWNVTFDGSRMQSSFRSQDIADSVQALQPGDDVTLRLTLENKADSAADWYMTNEVLDSLEDTAGTEASGGAYTYVLAYVGPDGAENVLFDSDTVGGERDDAANAAEGEGLHEATQTLEEYFYLDTLEAGESGQVTLNVALDGETQGNSYQDTLADLQMNFAVELAEQPVITATPGPTQPQRVPGATATPAPRQTEPASGRDFDAQTGDYTKILPWSIAALVSGAVILIYAVVRRRKEKGGSDHEETP